MSEQDMGKGKIVGLILTAGYSSRMGAFKPLLPIGDVTAIERVSATLKNAGVYEIIGVTGFKRERLSSIFASEGILEAFNPDFEQGMFSSVKAGLKKALDRLSPAGLTAARSSVPDSGLSPDGPAKTPGGFFLMPVDCPLVPSEVLKLILKKHKEDPEAFIVPCFCGKKGHPLFIPTRYAEEILAYEGEDGLKAITNRHESRLIRLETGIESVVLDMDTPEGYKEVLEFYSRESDAGYEEELKGKRLFLIRHGEIRQHREKIFLGQTDVPLSGKGREQAADAAEELKRYGISANRIYTSDLSRAAKTAEIIRDSLNGHRPVDTPGKEPRLVDIPGKEPRPAVATFGLRPVDVVSEPRLREMFLGGWDGRYISEIREKYPEEYQKRGENLLTYKYGNDSENFFDLQYRVMKGFQSILKREREAGDGCRDIVIVTHSGVINVIVSNLRHTDLQDEIGKRILHGGVVVIDYS